MLRETARCGASTVVCARSGAMRISFTIRMRRDNTRQSRSKRPSCAGPCASMSPLADASTLVAPDNKAWRGANGSILVDTAFVGRLAMPTPSHKACRDDARVGARAHARHPCPARSRYDDREAWRFVMLQDGVKVAGHRVHQMLIVLPLGTLITGVVFDIIHLATGNAAWALISFWLIVAGVITALLAAVFGALDYLSIPGGTRAKR